MFNMLLFFCMSVKEYNSKQIIQEIHSIFPKYKTRKRSYVDPRNYLICILYYKFNFTEEMITDVFRGTRFEMNRSTINHCKKAAIELAKIKDESFSLNVLRVYEKFPFDLPESKKLKFPDKEVVLTLSPKLMHGVNIYAHDRKIKKSTALRELIEAGLSAANKNIIEILWET